MTDLRVTPSLVPTNQPALVRVELESDGPVTVDHLCVLVYSLGGVRVAIIDLRSPDGTYGRRTAGRIAVEAAIPAVSLVEGEYVLGLYVVAGAAHGDFYDLAKFEVAAVPDLERVTPYAAVNRGFVELRPGIPQVTC